MGAWIEMIIYAFCDNAMQSLPTWGRGLKLQKKDQVAYTMGSLPTWGRGLKSLAGLVLSLALRRSLHGGVD